MSIMEEPLLSAENKNGQGEGKRWNPYEYVGREGCIIPTASLPETEVTVDEIRSAAASYNPNPPNLHVPVIGSPEHHYLHFHEPGFSYRRVTDDLQGRGLDDVEIRKLLVDHVGHHWCWGNRPARTWPIDAVENCNVYVGTLETFIEERETITETVPFRGYSKGNNKRPEVGIWELDLRSEFPVLFIPHKESRINVPHSEKVVNCPDCHGLGGAICPICNADQESGIPKENIMFQCPACYGRGLIAHKDGSDSICQKCIGTGKITCAACNSSGLIKCQTCEGCGSFMTNKIAIVRWKTLSTRKVSATSEAGSVPDDVFHKAKGVQLCNNQAQQCAPAYFADSYFLNKFSSEVIAERADVPPTARVICERHTIYVVPVIRVIMAHHNRSFSFYLIGCNREVYLGDDYPSRFCWGLCPCLEWLNA